MRSLKPSYREVLLQGSDQQPPSDPSEGVARRSAQPWATPGPKHPWPCGPPHRRGRGGASPVPPPGPPLPLAGGPEERLPARLGGRRIPVVSVARPPSPGEQHRDGSTVHFYPRTLALPHYAFDMVYYKPTKRTKGEPGPVLPSEAVSSRLAGTTYSLRRHLLVGLVSSVLVTIHSSVVRTAY
jgi:hypothetical protein